MGCLHGAHEVAEGSVVDDITYKHCTTVITNHAPFLTWIAFVIV